MLENTLKRYGIQTTSEIKDRIPSATGKTAKSVGYTVRPDGFQVYGAPYIFTLEDGRPPRGSSKPSGFLDSLIDWAKARGIGSGLPTKKFLNLVKFIRYRINQRGTQLWQKGGNSGVISNALPSSKLDKMNADLADDILIQIYKDIKKIK